MPRRMYPMPYAPVIIYLAVRFWSKLQNHRTPEASSSEPEAEPALETSKIPNRDLTRIDLLTYAKALDNALVTGVVIFLDVIKQTTAFANKAEQATT